MRCHPGANLGRRSCRDLRSFMGAHVFFTDNSLLGGVTGWSLLYETPCQLASLCTRVLPSTPCHSRRPRGQQQGISQASEEGAGRGSARRER
eukprot:3984141-Amphidinium_carterae.1